ncbi:MAG: hypothetical protein HY905_17640 [Deltaproteobacteria bacterium]|nr:hypothetical protein [Deltaproteobacteria bacterium]
MQASSARTKFDGTYEAAPRRRWLLGAVAGLALCGPASAQEEPPTDDPYADVEDGEATGDEEVTTSDEEAATAAGTGAEGTRAESTETAVAPAQAQPTGPQPTLFHVPPSSANAGEPLEITSTLSEPWQLRTVNLVYRRVDRQEWNNVPFHQVSTGDFVAVVPGADVASPAIEYYVESLDREGRTRRHFASPENPHRVEVTGMTSEQEEEIELQRFGGRHRFAAFSDWSSFGDRAVAGWVPSERRGDYTEPQLRGRTDDYVQFQAEYTYRILGIVQAIHFGFGIVRGHSPRLEYRVVDLQDLSADKETPGFNYGWTGITFQFHRYFGVGLEVYLGASQWGFDGGGGGYLRIGNTAETHFDLGCDYISNLGYKAWVTFQWDTVAYVPMSLTAEFTDWADPGDGGGDGIRLFYEAQAHVWAGLILTARVGYAARHGSNTGGPVVGGGVAYEF